MTEWKGRRTRGGGTSALALAAYLAVLPPTAPAGATSPGDAARIRTCESEDAAPAARLAACTELIKRRSLSEEIRAEALVNRGVLLDEQGRHAEAVADLTEALRLSPNDPSTLIHRGNAYDALGRKAEAFADYSEAVRLNPRDASGYFNRGTLLEEMGRTAEAVADYRKALEIDPGYEAAKAAMADLAKR
jgi:tetratricopeptide (TPR) repeat protein